MNTTKNSIALEFLSTFMPENSIALKINSSKTGGNNKSNYAMLLAKFFTFFLMGMVLFSACKKELDVLPSPGTANLNDTILKAGVPTYYIATNGSNAATGDITHPWLTLAYACAHATKAGDVIYVNSGIYTEKQRCNLAIGVSIRGAGQSAIIRAGFVGLYYKGLICLESPVGNPVNGNQSISNLRIEGVNLTSQSAITVGFRNNVEIHDVSIVDFYGRGITFISNNNYPNPPTVNYATGNKIYNCTITNSAGALSDHSSVNIKGQTGFIFYNNVCNNTARAVGSNGIIFKSDWMKGLQVYNNVFTKNATELSKWNFHIESWHFEGGCDIYNNTFNGGATLDLCDTRKGTYAYGLKVHDNKMTMPANVPIPPQGGMAIDFEEHGALQYLYVYNNRIKNYSSGIWVDALVNSTDSPNTKVNVDHVYFYSNLFENIGATNTTNTKVISMLGYGSNPNIIWDNIHIYNNTMTALATSRPGAGIVWNCLGTYTNISMKNNIIQGFTRNPISINAYAGSPTINTLSVQNNLYYGNGTNSPKYSAGVKITNKTESGFIVGNPLFVSSSDFHLRSGSPAIDKGINVGLAYNGSAPDIATFEFSN